MKYYEDLNQVLKRLNINNIITNDIDAWENNKINNKIYNKLWLTQLQNIDCGPIGTHPKQYPIIIKPIINLYGMSKGFMKINSEEEYYENQKYGHFWMPYLSGKNYTIDLILDNGKIKGYYTLESKPTINGTFEYHVYRPKYKLSENIKKIIEENFISYSGAMNIELINDKIIEGHLRLNGDYYIFDDKFIQNISNLINKNPYELKVKKKSFYLFPYFVTSNFNLNIISKDEIEEILNKNKVYNIRWDNIYSEYQRNDLCRLLMFKVESLKLGNKIIKLINKNFYLRERVYNFINKK